MLKEKFESLTKFQNCLSSNDLDLTSMPIRLNRIFTMENVDDFNDGTISPLWLRESTSNPIESSGFLQFSYNVQNPPSSQVVFNSERDYYELETRFICETISNNIPPYEMYFVPYGISVLGAPVITPSISDAQYEQKLVWECWLNWSPYTNYLAFLPFCYGDDNVRYFWKNSENRWVQDPGPSGRQAIFLANPSGIPITIKAERSGDGIVIKAYKNDTPGQVIFQTAQSPILRQFNKYFLELAHKPNFGGGRTKFDYFKLSGSIIEPDTGEIIFRRSFPIKTKVTNYQIDRILPNPNSKLNFKIRSADSINELEQIPFKEPITKVINGNIETGLLNITPGLYFDIKLEFLKGSSPLLNSFNFDFIPQPVDDDLPLILSVDESGPKLAMVTSSEEGLTETENTKKLIDGVLNTQWVSLNSSDNTPVTLQITFLGANGGNELRNINCVILRKTNIKELRIHSGVTTLFEGEINEDNVLIPFNEISTPIIQIEARTTKTPNQNKKIGECYCGRILAVLPGFDLYEPGFKYFEHGILRTLNGKLINFRGNGKYFSKWKIIYVEDILAEELKMIFLNEPLITFYPEPKAKPLELYDVSWNLDVLSYPYSSQFKNAGYTIEAEMTEL